MGVRWLEEVFVRRFLLAAVVGSVGCVVTLALAAGPALACGGLIGRNGSVNLVRTTTLAAYHDGVEHYVTSFQFAGTGGEFGSIVPLPGVPSNVERGGGWTLQRLVKEVSPPVPVLAPQAFAAAGVAKDSVVELQNTRIDALDITILQGGADGLVEWAHQHGYVLPADASAVFDFYARRSPIFLAARFDGDAAQRQGTAIGDGTPVHLTIPTSNPWVPLRILSLGRQPDERISADVFLLTDRQPALLPGTDAPGLSLGRQEPASASLLNDLRADKGMAWVPESSWLTYLRVNAAPGELTYDLAVDASGAGRPSAEAAGLPPTASTATASPQPHGFAAGLTHDGRGLAVAVAVGVIVLGAALVVIATGRRAGAARAARG
jgi:hypothetical protein